jgi:hypothetical protein
MRYKGRGKNEASLGLLPCRYRSGDLRSHHASRHIGSINLWITVSGLVFAEEIIVLVTLNAARRRFMPLTELPTSEGRMEVLS